MLAARHFRNSRSTRAKSAPKCIQTRCSRVTTWCVFRFSCALFVFSHTHTHQCFLKMDLLIDVVCTHQRSFYFKTHMVLLISSHHLHIFSLIFFSIHSATLPFLLFLHITTFVVAVSHYPPFYSFIPFLLPSLFRLPSFHQVKLAELSEGAILHNLRMRYVANDIYVRLKVCLSIFFTFLSVAIRLLVAQYSRHLHFVHILTSSHAFSFLSLTTHSSLPSTLYTCIVHTHSVSLY